MLIKVSIVFTQKKKKTWYTSSLVLLLQGNTYHFASKVCQCFWLYILITFFWDLLFYLLKNVSFTTTDIDDCEEDKKFTDKQICVNKPWSYDCLCIKGCHKSVRSSHCKNYVILPHQKSTLLFYHIILQYLIYQMFYIFTSSFKYYFLILFNFYFILSLYLFLTVIFVSITIIFSNLINSSGNIFKQSS